MTPPPKSSQDGGPTEGMPPKNDPPRPEKPPSSAPRPEVGEWKVSDLIESRAVSNGAPVDGGSTGQEPEPISDLGNLERYETRSLDLVFDNAQVGRAYSFVVPDKDRRGAPLSVKEVRIAPQSGLKFEGAQVTGSPLAAGVIEVVVVWSVGPNGPKYQYRTVIDVIADPRSLWREVEPPDSDPFRKQHTAHQQVDCGGLRVIAASRRGRSHAHGGKFREDDYYIGYDKPSGLVVVAVADGAGSAELSREGSRIAVETVVTDILAELCAEDGKAFDDTLGTFAEALDDAPDEEKNVTAGACKNLMGAVFSKAVTNALVKINEAASAANKTARDFATTLLALATKPLPDGRLFGAAFWVGDGALATYDRNGNIRLLGEPDSGEFAGQTRFLTAREVDPNIVGGRIRVGIWSGISHVFLMTDGVSDPKFETDNELRSPERWQALVDELSALDGGFAAENASAELLNWLLFFSPGNHDDRTIACIVPLAR